MSRPSVLFVCVHNAGRSQMAQGWLQHLAGDRVEVRSAGSAPGDRINPVAVEAMAEFGIDITAEHPKILTVEAVQDSDVVITMGCGDTCPIFPGKRYEDWDLTDPAGRGIDVVREAMLEEGIDISAEKPKILTTEAVQTSDVVITMGCGDTCPIYPGKRYEDWTLDDPAGQGLDVVRPIRDAIRQRVEALLEALGLQR